MRQASFYVYTFFLIWLLTGCTAISEQIAADIPEGETATVTGVIDGDTIEVVSNGRSYRVRYIGVDTPERDEPFYAEATQANRDLVAGKTIILVKDVSDTDQYGRLLRYIYLPDGTFVNAALMRDGFARLVTFPPDVREQAYLRELQREARQNGRGLWAQTELGSLPIGCDICERNAYDCRDFDTQASAQACYEACLELVGEDIHNLDGGGDGVVCEALP